MRRDLAPAIALLGARCLAQPCNPDIWTRVDPAPGHRIDAAVAFDAVRGRAIFFGGYNTMSLAETWVFDPAAATWTLLSQQPQPPLRDSASMVFDTARDRAVLFGGMDSNRFLYRSDTWEWNPITGAWSQLSPAASPSARQGAAMAYDPVRRTAILFGGEGSDHRPMGDTWEWDGAAGAWTQLFPMHSPSAREFSGMAYDPAGNRFILFSGDGSGGADTWGWSPGPRDWTLLHPPISPGARSDHSLVTDFSRGHIVLFGGYPGYGDTWEFDGSSDEWTERAATSALSARFAYAAFYDPGSARVFLFDGSTSPGPNPADLWWWDASGGAWVPVQRGLAPGARFGPGLAYDSMRDRLVLFGGLDNAAADGTWEWAGDAWARVESPVPSGYVLGLAYDGLRTICAVGPFSGAPIEIWAWDGNAWAVLAANGPPYNGAEAIAFDSLRRRLVLHESHTVDGTLVTNTWEWDGSDWSLFSNVGPQLISSSISLAFDPIRQVTIGFVSSYQTNAPVETWAWGQEHWTRLMPTQSPTPRARPTLVFDDDRGAIILFGGTRAGAMLSDAWRWDGRTWSQLPIGPIAGRFGASAAYDSRRGRVVMHGGSAGTVGQYYQAWGDTEVLGCPCYPNCDRSTTPPTLNVNDFICFLNRFAAADPYANCDGSTIPPILNFTDFECFLNHFAAGCP